MFYIPPRGIHRNKYSGSRDVWNVCTDRSQSHSKSMNWSRDYNSDISASGCAWATKWGSTNLKEASGPWYDTV